MVATDVSLATWNDTPARAAISEFVDRVTRPGSADFVSPEARVATFDNDGTLWTEKPLPIQADFLLRRLVEMASVDSSLASRHPWKAAVEKDYAWLNGVLVKHYGGDDSDLQVLASGLLRAYEGSTIEEFEVAARAYLQAGVHPTLRRPYISCVYQPMRELLQYLAAHGFSCFIASGGGRDFMRTISESCFGIPPERVIGSSVSLEFREVDGVGQIVHTAKLDVLDDGPAKPVRIWSRVGRRPILAAGNANGDIPMLSFAHDARRPSLRLLVRHDDAQREFDYSAGAELALARAESDGWTIVSVKNDWATVFAD